MSVISLIASRNFIAVNKTLIKEFGLEEAIILGELASEHSYWADRGELDADGYFFSTIENIEENTALKEKRQRSAINSLKDAGIIEVKLKGLPAKRYIKINADQVAAVLLNCDGGGGGASSVKKAELEPPEKPGNKNNSTKTNNKNKEIIISIVEFLNQQAGTNYRPTTKATQAHINARLAEGYTEQDFYTVIMKKCAEWKGDERMAQYLRPETLFGSKFESYLNAPATKRKAYGANGIEINQTDEDDLAGIL